MSRLVEDLLTLARGDIGAPIESLPVDVAEVIDEGELRAQLDKIESEIAAARSASAVADLVLAGDDLRATWQESPPDVRGKVIDALMTVTVLPAVGRGRRPGGVYFDPNYIGIEWKA